MKIYYFAWKNGKKADKYRNQEWTELTAKEYKAIYEDIFESFPFYSLIYFKIRPIEIKKSTGLFYTLKQKGGRQNETENRYEKSQRNSTNALVY